MKIIFILIFVLIGCSKTIHYVENGELKEITVSRFDIVSETEMLVKIEEPIIVKDNNYPCTYAGFCFGCGLEFLSGKYSCGVGFYHNCSGKQYREMEITVIKYKMIYKIVNNNNTEFVTPIQERSKTKVLKEGNCH